MAMKTLRQQIIDRIKGLGGDSALYDESFSDYDLLEDYESLLRAEIEAELKHESSTSN